jgi:hypothetical protein
VREQLGPIPRGKTEPPEVGEAAASARDAPHRPGVLGRALRIDDEHAAARERVLQHLRPEDARRLSRTGLAEHVAVHAPLFCGEIDRPPRRAPRRQDASLRREPDERVSLRRLQDEGDRVEIAQREAEPLEVVIDSGDLLGEPGVPERGPPPVRPEESYQRSDDGRGCQQRVQRRGDLEPGESMRVLSDRGRVEPGAAAFAEDEAGVKANEEMTRNDQADDEGEDAIDEADRLAGHSRVNCNARDKRSDRAVTCAALWPARRPSVSIDVLRATTCF